MLIALHAVCAAGMCCFAICQESAEIDYQKKTGNAGKPTQATGAHPPPPTSQPPPAQQM